MSIWLWILTIIVILVVGGVLGLAVLAMMQRQGK